MARARGLMGRVASIAAAGGDLAPEAWDLLEEVWLRRERNVAMEAAMALLGTRREEGPRRLLRSLPAADPAVRRQAVRFLALSGPDAKALFPELRAALEAERDPETSTSLVAMAAGIGSEEAARAILSRAPAPPRSGAEPPSRRDREDDRDAELRDAIVDALAGQEAEGVRAWLQGKAFGDATEGALWTLARVAARREDEGARPALEALIEKADGEVALEAISALSAIGLEGSRRAVVAAARSERTSPRVACAAALALAPVDRRAAVEEILDLSRRPDWERRAAAAEALATLADDEPAFRRCSQLLGDPNRDVRAAAFRSLRAFRRKEAIPAVAALLVPLRSPDAAAAVSYLEWATGQRFGRDRVAWLRWWKDAESGFRFPAAEPSPAIKARPSRPPGRAP